MFRPKKYSYSREMLWRQDIDSSFHPYHLLRRKAGIYEFLGRWTEAEGIYLRNLDFSKKFSVSILIAESQMDLASALYGMNLYEKADEFLVLSSDIYQSAGNQKGLAEVWLKRGNIKVELGDYSAGIDFYERAINICRTSGNIQTLSTSLSNLGNALYFRNDLDGALGYYKQGVEIELSLENKDGLAKTYGNIAGIYYTQNIYGKAEEYFLKKLDLCLATGNPIEYASTMFTLGKVYQQTREYGKCMDCLVKYMDAFQRLGDRKWTAHILAARSELLTIEGKHDQALDLNLRACGIFEELKLSYYHCFYLCSRAEMLMKSGEFRNVGGLLDRAEEIGRQVNSHELDFNIAIARARFLSVDDPQKAAELLEEKLRSVDGEEERAVLNYELFKHTKDIIYKERSLTLYRDLYRDSGAPEFKEIIDELAGISG